MKKNNHKTGNPELAFVSEQRECYKIFVGIDDVTIAGIKI